MNHNLQEFIKRNTRRNAHLYNLALTEGVDYIVCPVSQARMSMIKSSYIERVLGMTVEEYDTLYPGARKVCESRKTNIKAGLKQIDADTGLTKYQLSQQKAQAILSTADENGVTGYKKKGQATRATHMSKIDELGRNGYSRIASTAIIKGNATKASKGMISLNRSEFKRYKTVVFYLTERYRDELSEGYITGLAGTLNAWHLDHKFSILSGYQQRVSPFIIGHKNNLQMVPWEDNLQKHTKSSVALAELLEQCNYSVEQSQTEFDKIYQLITEDIKDGITSSAAFLIERFYGSNLHP